MLLRGNHHLAKIMHKDEGYSLRVIILTAYDLLSDVIFCARSFCGITCTLEELFVVRIDIFSKISKNLIENLSNLREEILGNAKY